MYFRHMRIKNGLAQYYDFDRLLAEDEMKAVPDQLWRTFRPSGSRIEKVFIDEYALPKRRKRIPRYEK